MLLVSLKKHFPARMTEWLGGAAMLSWGAYVLNSPGLFTHPATREVYEGMAQLVAGFPSPAATTWGLAAVSVAFARLLALFINGAYIQTPAIRVIVSFFSAFIWTQVCVGLMSTGVANAGIMIYAWMIVADLISAYRAAIDVVYAGKQHFDDHWQETEDRERSNQHIS